MSKYHISQIDIIIILLATLCTITVNLPIFISYFTMLNDVFFILSFFILGYALLISIFPINTFSIIKRVSYSFLIGIGLLALIIILKNMIFTSLIVAESDLSIFLAILTIAFVILAYIRRKKDLSSNTKNWVACQRCGGYYELQNGESLEDFERCQCGGKLYYANFDIKDVKTNKNMKTPEKSQKRNISSYLAINFLLMFLIPVLNIISLNISQLSGSIVRIISVSILIFFLSGYSLTTVISPLNRQMNKIKRFVLSVVFSIAFFVLLYIGFTLNQPIFSSTTSVLIISVITIFLTLISIIRMFISSEDKIDKSHVVSKEKYEFKNLTEEKIEEKQIFKSRHTSMDLLLIFLTTILCLIFELTVPDKSFVEIIFGLLFVLFLPGYILIAVIFPKKNDLEKIEREALSFCFSVLIAPIIGLLLNYTPYGINLTPLTISLAILTIVMEIPAYIRRQKVPKENRFSINFKHFNKMAEDEEVKGR